MEITKNIYFVHDDGSAELKCGEHIILIDASDVERLSHYQWSVGTHGYATHGSGNKQVLMHRLLAAAETSEFVDHINQNKLDNRKANLRICSQQQNAMNRSKEKTGSNPYKGLCLTPDGKWQAQIAFNKKSIYLGRFNNPETAAKAYDTAARKLFGEYGSLNFPNSTLEVAPDIKHYKKMSDDEIDSLRMLYATGIPITDIAEMCGRSYSSVRRVVKNITYRN